MESLSLQGEWKFALDPNNVGATERWFERELSETIALPNSLDCTSHAPENFEREATRLTRTRRYVGAAWFQRVVTIPASWQGKLVTLELERPHGETTLWIGANRNSRQSSLCVPHRHFLGSADALGETVTLTLRVDNTLHLDVHGKHGAHSVTDETQTNWNGIVGQIRLVARDAIHLSSGRLTPKVSQHRLEIDAVIVNTRIENFEGQFTLQIPGTPCGLRTQKTLVPGVNRLHFEVPVNGHLKTWDEFSPCLYDLEISLRAGECASESTTSFGWREITVEGTRFCVNGRPIFLRGTMEGCEFPLSGHPPTDVESWRRIFRIAKDYGLNHLRFHSWCPPEAAFEAADEAGFLVQVEMPAWVSDVGRDDLRDAFLWSEVRAMCQEYGNHPSFALVSMGNEMTGDVELMGDWTRLAKANDSRHFYSVTTMSFDYGGHAPGDGDFYCGHRIQKAFIRCEEHVRTKIPATDTDWSAPVEAFGRPLISHEIGQYLVYPNFEEIPKYTGPLKPFNFEMGRESLQKSGMGEQARDFGRASGLWAAQLYKEDIEAALRTGAQAGFLLLDLHDYPGQGNATVGMLDVFWDSKGLISPQDFRQFCSPTVPLLRLPKRVFESGETLHAPAQLAHYGPHDLEKACPVWRIKNEGGEVVAAGKWASRDIPTGKLSDLGPIEAKLVFPSPTKLSIEVEIEGVDARNHWEIWLYPSPIEAPQNENVRVVREWNDDIAAWVKAGGHALYLPRLEGRSDTSPITFPVSFWSTIYFPDQPGSMGLCCDPTHPALRDFPTDEHSNWQWFDLTVAGNSAFVLNEAPTGWKPILQIVDRSERNNRLGLLFEARLGQGRLMVCSVDLESDLEARPVARQLRLSVLNYLSATLERSALERSALPLQEIGFAP